MDKINFENLPSTNTPVNASDLNQMQSNIENAINTKANLATTPQTPSGNTQVNSVQLGYNDGGWILNINANTSGQNVDFAVGIDELSNYYNKSNIYSTNETRIGTWINGKPIYRKVINVGQPSISSGSTYRYNHGISNIELIVTQRAFWVNSNSDTYFAMPYINGATNTSIERITTSEVYIKATGEGWQGHTLYIILEYTKTTD